MSIRDDQNFKVIESYLREQAKDSGFSVSLASFPKGEQGGYITIDTDAHFGLGSKVNAFAQDLQDLFQNMAYNSPNHPANTTTGRTRAALRLPVRHLPELAHRITALQQAEDIGDIAPNAEPKVA